MRNSPSGRIFTAAALLSFPLTLYALVDTTLQISGYGTIGSNAGGGTLTVGNNNFVSAQYSAAIGNSLRLYNNDSLAVGRFSTNSFNLFTVGRGASDTSRNDAFAVLNDGTVEIPGTVEITAVTIKGGVSGTVTFTPVWWSDPSYNIFKSPAGAGSNTSPANVGQLKNVAIKAKAYLDWRLAGWSGAGTAVNTMCTFPNSENYSALSVGQLKSMGKVFHDRLRSIGYNWQLPGTTGTLPGQPYPWTGTAHADNSAPASIGQIKRVFGFEVSAAYLIDADSDLMLDGWETAHFGTTARNGTGDWDGDGLTDKQEFDLGLRPTVADAVFDDSSRRLDVFNLSTF